MKALLILTFSIGILLKIVEMREWWEDRLFHGIYVRSFKDTNDDGIGDLKGVTENLHHLADSGINAIIFHPFLDSPFVEGGFDIRDYYKVSSEYGNMQNFENLVAKAKELDIRILMELMVNHCSNESEYFQKSVRREEGYEDFFVWANGTTNPDTNETMPPNNWQNVIKGSAWEWHEKRQQFYLHQYYKTEPDFNYRNPDVFDEMINIMTFYLDKGIDGFKLNSVFALVEAMNPDGTYPDEPLRPDGSGKLVHINTHDRNESYELLYRWRSFMDSYSGRVGGDRRILLTGTNFATNFTFAIKYYGNYTHNGSSIPYNYDLAAKEINNQSNANDVVFQCKRWLSNVPKYQVPNWILGDVHGSRVASRLGTFKRDGLTMLQLMLPRVAITYQGDEIAMLDGEISESDNTDIFGKERGLNFSRDPERTPFQWDDTKNAGFSNASTTWLPVASSYPRINLRREKRLRRSYYKVYQAAAFSRNQTAVKHGFMDLKAITNNVFALTRFKDGYQTWGMVMNIGSGNVTVDLTQMKGLGRRLRVVESSLNSMKRRRDRINPSNVRLMKEESFIFMTQPRS